MIDLSNSTNVKSDSCVEIIPMENFKTKNEMIPDILGQTLMRLRISVCALSGCKVVHYSTIGFLDFYCLLVYFHSSF